MMVFEIKGRLLVNDVNSHQEMINKLYETLKKNGFFFIGETKNITDDYSIENEIN